MIGPKSKQSGNNKRDKRVVLRRIKVSVVVVVFLQRFDEISRLLQSNSQMGVWDACFGGNCSNLLLPFHFSA